jgi:hypothetical protein
MPSTNSRETSSEALLPSSSCPHTRGLGGCARAAMHICWRACPAICWPRAASWHPPSRRHPPCSTRRERAHARALAAPPVPAEWSVHQVPRRDRAPHGTRCPGSAHVDPAQCWAHGCRRTRAPARRARRRG